MLSRFLSRVIGAAVALAIVLFVFHNASAIAEQGRQISEYASLFRGGASASQHSQNPEDSRKTTDDGAQLEKTPNGQAEPEKSPEQEAPIATEDKIVVIGRLEKEDTTWVHENLPDWQTAIYTVDNTSAALHTPQNKGREANVYLHYIIQHYHALPATIVFLHAHRNGYPTAWHNDVPDYDNVNALRTLSTAFVQRNGYANLRCNWTPGCPSEIQYRRPLAADADEATNVDHKIPEVWRRFFGAESAVPETIAAACCAQFAVSRDQVRRRSLEEYQRYHRWLMETEYDDQTSGTIMEYMWHIIFGQEPVYCPQMSQCYRDVYGRPG